MWRSWRQRTGNRHSPESLPVTSSPTPSPRSPYRTLNQSPAALRRNWYPQCGGDKWTRSLWQHWAACTGQGLALHHLGHSPRQRPWKGQEDGAQPGLSSALEAQGTEGEQGCCSLGCVTHCCLAGARMARGRKGVGKRLTVEPAPFSSLLLLSSTYNSPGQELVPEGSPFLQAEEDTPCKRKTQTPS